jgi:hypothetical protein
MIDFLKERRKKKVFHGVARKNKENNELRNCESNL